MGFNGQGVEKGRRIEVNLLRALDCRGLRGRWGAFRALGGGGFRPRGRRNPIFIAALSMALGHLAASLLWEVEGFLSAPGFIGFGFSGLGFRGFRALGV